MALRLAAAKAMIDHPRVKVTDIEDQLRSQYTADTIAHLQRLYPSVRFVWLMGADNLAQFHRWQNWRGIAEAVPIAVIARAGQRLGARRSKAAKTYRNQRIKGRAGRLLGSKAAPAWTYQNIPMLNLSSTEIRARGRWHLDED